MKKKISILVTFAVFFVSGMETHAVFASEIIQSRFGNVTLNIPNPSNLCRLKNSGGERERQTLEMNKKLQKQQGNKLLAYWTDCDSQKQLRRPFGDAFLFNEWVIIGGALSGEPPQEKTFPQLTQKLFLKSMLKEFDNVDLDTLYSSATKKVNKDFDKILPNYFDGSANLSEPINLGLLAVTDSIHIGSIFNVKIEPLGDRPVAAIFSSALIKGVFVQYFFYSEYKNKSTIKTILSKAKFYSAKLTNVN